MSSAPSFRERLPSAIGAIALQAGLFALLALSFTVVRQVTAEKETILILPPLVQQPAPTPMTIDARGPAKPAPGALPGRAVTASQGAAPTSGDAVIPAAPALPPTDCVPQGVARPASRVPCPVPPRPAQTNEIPMLPGHDAKAEARWGKTAPKDNPSSVTIAPGVTVGPGGPGVQLTIQDPLCKLASVFLKIVCGARPTYNLSTEAQFQAARAAAQARTRSIYGAPVLASPPKAGDGDEKNGVSGNAGGDAGGNGAGAGR